MIKQFTDLGHGGKDSGALGIGGVKESDIVLDIGKRVHEKLSKQKDMTDYLSREKDIYLTLSERTNKSNSLGANSQVSIHCNSFKDKSAKGLEIFYMSENGKRLAKFILDEFVWEGLHNGLREWGLKYANHHMNREAKATSCLIELGFITNQIDLDLIMKNKDKIATAIAKGICKYHGIIYIDNVTTNNKKYTNCILYGNDVDKVAAEILSWSKEDCILKNVKDHTAWEGYNLFVVGGPAEDKLKEMNTKEKYTAIIGTNRFDTVRKCLELTGK